MPTKKLQTTTQIKRDKNGLITQPNVDYIFNEDGLIDWRKMVKEEFLFANKQKTKETDVSKLEDHELIIKLAGLKELAQIRGYTDVHHKVTAPTPDYVISSCSITWIPNYETEDKEVTFTSIGDAGPHNTNGFGQMFLAAMAENRAFGRCVRNFLRIHVVAQEEMANGKVFEEPTENHTDPKLLLESVMKEKNVSFEQIKTRLADEKFDGAEDFVSVADIPTSKIFELIQRIKNKSS